MSEVVQVALCKKCNANRALSEFTERRPGIRRKLCFRHDKKRAEAADEDDKTYDWQRLMDVLRAWNNEVC